MNQTNQAFDVAKVEAKLKNIKCLSDLTGSNGVIQEMIDGEDATAPLSDVDIAQRLKRQGLTVARRTVTKYRQLLQVPPVERRRVHAGEAAA